MPSNAQSVLRNGETLLARQIRAAVATYGSDPWRGTSARALTQHPARRQMCGHHWQTDQVGRTPSDDGAGPASAVTRMARKRRSRSAFETTVTDDRAIAPAAKMGSSSQPVNG